MICPGCKKESYNEISICVSCGTMINDSVREELAPRITIIKKESVQIEKQINFEKPTHFQESSNLVKPFETEKPIKIEKSVEIEKYFQIDPVKETSTPKIILKGKPIVQEKSNQPNIQPSIQEAKPSRKVVNSTPAKTTEISIKQTSSTLLEFQNKNAPLPDWRLQLQNAVKQRQSGQSHNLDSAVAETQTIAAVTTYPTQGGAALKARIDEITLPEDVDNDHLRNALARIELSRNRFLKVEPETDHNDEVSEQKPGVYQNNLRIATKDDKPVPVSTELKTSADFQVKPKLVPSIAEKRVKNFYDTSELDPAFPPAAISSSFEKPEFEARNESIELKENAEEKQKAEKLKNLNEDVHNETLEQTKTVKQSNKQNDSVEENEELIDDFAPFSLRFNAGLFDLIIGSFLSLLLLSPFMLLGQNWFTLSGFFAFLATCAIVMFLYQTISIGVFGKTFGMHLFSLEMIDLDGEQYPTFHQAAVSSSIYLLSLLFLGIGFITTIFDEDKRSVHDIVSGTLVVKEI